MISCIMIGIGQQRSSPAHTAGHTTRQSLKVNRMETMFNAKDLKLAQQALDSIESSQSAIVKFWDFTKSPYKILIRHRELNDKELKKIGRKDGAANLNQQALQILLS